MSDEDVIVEVLAKVSGWVRGAEALHELAKRSINLTEAKLLDLALSLEDQGRLRSMLYFQAVPT